MLVEFAWDALQAVPLVPVSVHALSVSMATPSMELSVKSAQQAARHVPGQPPIHAQPA